MKALTIWQPWCSLIIIGAKPFEFRGWLPGSVVGQRFVLHAGARPVKRAEVEDLLQRLGGRDAWTTCLDKEKAVPLLLDCLSRTAQPLPLSAGLGTALLGRPRVGSDIARDFGAPAGDSRRHEHSHWAWPMGEVRPFDEPITAKGAQGFWDWDGGDVARFERNL